MNFLFAFVGTFVLCWVTIPILLVFLGAINFYTTVMEGRAKVYVLFGRVLGVVSEPGLHFLWLQLGPQAVLVRFFGQVHEIDIRLDQEYLRSNTVNTEEGTPMGLGVWYEMRVRHPVEYLFKNVDPRGSLRANVANVIAATSSGSAGVGRRNTKASASIAPLHSTVAKPLIRCEAWVTGSWKTTPITPA